MGVLLSESEMDSVMRAFDHNRNGKVDFLEFYGQLARHRPARDAAPLRAVAPAPLSPRRPEVAARGDGERREARHLQGSPQLHGALDRLHRLRPARPTRLPLAAERGRLGWGGWAPRGDGALGVAARR
jgi:hypothetical protein